MATVVFYSRRRGDQPVAEHIKAVAKSDADRAASMLDLIETLREKGHATRMPDARPIDRDAGIYELRPTGDRIAYGEHKSEYVLLHAWKKQGNRIKPADLRTARNRMEDWREGNR